MSRLLQELSDAIDGTQLLLPGNERGRREPRLEQPAAQILWGAQALKRASPAGVEVDNWFPARSLGNGHGAGVGGPG